jgi:archaellum component FlaD/FlaE
MLAFGTLVDLPLILQQIGGIALMAHEARQEQDGTVVRELPTATDPRFVVEKDETTAEDEAKNTEVAEEPAEQPTDGTAESEESSEATEGTGRTCRGDETAAARK